MYSKIKKLIDEVEVVSFDIFDTLLLRPYVDPDDLFLHLEKIYKVPGFYEARKSAYHLFLNKYKDAPDVTFDNIYSVLNKKFAFLQPIELEYEEKILRANPEIKEIYEYALKQKKRIIFSTDMYLPMPFIVNILQKNDFSGYEKIYLSCEIGKRKSSGAMYPYILRDQNISANKVLHIGDNKSSDIKMAKIYGFKTFYYQKVIKRFFKKNNRAKLFYQQKKSLGRSIIVSLLALRDIFKTSTNNYWNDFGYLYAGVAVHSYVKWIECEAKKKDISKLLFVARDGYLPENVFKLINSEIESYYVYAPRILNYTTNLTKKEKSKTIVNCFYKKYASVQKLVDKEKFDCETSYTEFIDKNISLFEELSQKELNSSGYEEYINKFITDSESTIGVVDSISVQFSAQNLIETSIKKPTLGFYWAIPDEDSIQKMLDYCEFSPEYFLLLKQYDRKSIGHFIELFFSAPEPPVISFDKGKPIQKDNIQSQEQVRIKNHRYITKGAMSFAKDILSFFGNQDIYVTQKDIIALISLYYSEPTKEDIRAMQQIKFSDDHISYYPLLSVNAPFWKRKKYKKCLWKTPLQHIVLALSTPFRIKVRGLRYINIKIFPYVSFFFFNISIIQTKKIKYSFSIGNKSNEFEKN